MNKTDLDFSNWITVKDFARLTFYSERQILRLIHARRLRGKKIGRLYYLPHPKENWLTQKEVNKKLGLKSPKRKKRLNN